MKRKLRVVLKPHIAGSELLELGVLDDSGTKVANVVFAPIQDRHDHMMLSIRDQNNFAEELRQKRLLTLMTLFMIHRYKAVSVHYVTPTEDNQRQAEGMKALGIYSEIQTEIGQIIVAKTDGDNVKELLKPDRKELRKLIAKG